MKQYKRDEPLWDTQVKSVAVTMRPDGLLQIELDHGLFLTLDSHDCTLLLQRIQTVSSMAGKVWRLGG